MMIQVSDLRQARCGLPQQAALHLNPPPRPLLHKETRVGQCRGHKRYEVLHLLQCYMCNVLHVTHYALAFPSLIVLISINVQVLSFV